MKKLIILSLMSCVCAAASAQFVYKIKADSVKITNDSCNAELILENSTKNIKGFLYNYGNGRTRFQKGLIKIGTGDSLYQIGADTLNLSYGGSLNAWRLNGNTGINPSTNFLGTTDTAKLILKTNNQQRVSILADGTVNVGISDTASKPLFRIYPNGDFTVRAKNNLAGNTSGLNNGIRYNAKYGVLEVGTNNNFDTLLSTVCCGSQSKSAIIINSDILNSFKGHVHASIVGGDHMTVDTLGSIQWSSVFGETHYINASVNKSAVSGSGMNIGKATTFSTIGGAGHSIQKPVSVSMIYGYINSPVDTVNGSIISGVFNQFGGIGQFVSGLQLVNKTPAGTTLGNQNVDFSSLNYVGYSQSLSLSTLSNLDKYPVFSIGNSRYSLNSGSRSNALTILYNGRTQINTTGYLNNLTEANVTPKAALEIVSNNSGILIPKLTTAQRDSIVSADLQNGLLLYNTTNSKFQFYNGTYWKSLSDTSVSGGGGDAFLANTQTFTSFNKFSGGFATTSFADITSGSSSTVGNSITTVRFNPASDLDTYTLTMPASPTDGQWLYISFGGTISVGSAVVSYLTLSPNTGQSIYGSITLTQGYGGDEAAYQYESTTTTWKRKK